jgi:hypothetical protein
MKKQNLNRRLMRFVAPMTLFLCTSNIIVGDGWQVCDTYTEQTDVMCASDPSCERACNVTNWSMKACVWGLSTCAGTPGTIEGKRKNGQCNDVIECGCELFVMPWYDVETTGDVC